MSGLTNITEIKVFLSIFLELKICLNLKELKLSLRFNNTGNGISLLIINLHIVQKYYSYVLEIMNLSKSIIV